MERKEAGEKCCEAEKNTRSSSGSRKPLARLTLHVIVYLFNPTMKCLARRGSCHNSELHQQRSPENSTIQAVVIGSVDTVSAKIP